MMPEGLDIQGLNIPEQGLDMGKREGQIPEAQTAMYAALDTLDATIEELSVRLRPVLRPEAPEITAPKGATPETVALRAPVAEVLGQQRGRVNLAAMKVREIIQRIEA